MTVFPTIAYIPLKRELIMSWEVHLISTMLCHFDDQIANILTKIFVLFMIKTPAFPLGQTFCPEEEIPHERTALMQRSPFGSDTLL